MIKPLALLLATALVPSLAMSDTLELPADAEITVQVIDTLTLDNATPRHDDIVLRPVANSDARHRLPDYCVVIGDAQRDGERIRLTTKALTCIETEGSESEIYSGEFSAGAYDRDGHFGLDACQAERCTLRPEHHFTLRLASPIRIEEQVNPSAEINAERRRADEAAEAGDD
ncbi:hypothetical protein [Halomonas cerina]|uniref:Uncharacterized protein n=1 Tax=Halomonas cerina TaxID=447424 RepID=A0A839V9D3_9GAMM|nr:hypothetical protein [Halomonas cerina]MBB3189337.1 hypothetical protein [Halomonas cerina]